MNLNHKIVVALDCMGGDFAPRAALAGAEQALSTQPEVKIILVGKKDQLSPIVEQSSLLSSRCEILHAENVVSDEDRPAIALRRSAGTSMRLAVEQVASGNANCVVSAGNTGAFMAISMSLLRTLDYIERPAIISTLPAKNGSALLLDSGANIGCDANMLVQFAIIGNAWAKDTYNSNPSVALLNIGSEENKGNDSIREAARLLKSMPLNFVGFVEPNNVIGGSVDVIVCDGFLGNAVLKASEGTAYFIKQLMQEAFKSSWYAKMVGAMSHALLRKKMGPAMDVRKRGGGFLAGLNGIVVKAHGASQAEGYAGAIDSAIKTSHKDVNHTLLRDAEIIYGKRKELE